MPNIRHLLLIATVFLSSSSVLARKSGFLEAVKALPYTFPMSFEVPNAINQ